MEMTRLAGGTLPHLAIGSGTIGSRWLAYITMKKLLSTILVAFFAASVALGLGFPAKPVTLIVPQAPGGANDTIARIYAAKMSTLLGQPFVVDNRPGAGGNIGTVAATRARPDGYTLILNLSTTQVVNPSLYANAGFDPVKDFQPVTMLASAAYLLVANAGFAPNSVTALIAQASSSDSSSIPNCRRQPPTGSWASQRYHRRSASRASTSWLVGGHSSRRSPSAPSSHHIANRPCAIPRRRPWAPPAASRCACCSCWRARGACRRGYAAASAGWC